MVSSARGNLWRFGFAVLLGVGCTGTSVPPDTDGVDTEETAETSEDSDTSTVDTEDSSDDTDDTDAVVDTDIECSDLVTYETVGEPFLLTWCTPCHSSTLSEEERQEAPLELNFDTYAGTFAELEEIFEEAVEGEDMPPAGGPTPEERQLFGEWIVCGAPE